MFKKIDLLTIAPIFIVIFLFFLPIFQSKVPIPSDTLVGLYHPWRDLYQDEYPRGIPYKNFLITDPIRQQIPWRKITIDAFKSGTLPLWNPYALSGAPLIGNIQSGALYPLNILFLLMPFLSAWTSLIVLQPILGGIFMFLYLRFLKIHPVANTISTIAWIFSGFSIAWLTWGTIVHTALWLPLILLSIDQLLGKSKRHKDLLFWTLVLFAALTCSFFAGHVQIFIYIVGISFSYGCFRFLSQKSDIKSLIYIFGSVLLFFISTFYLWKELLLNVLASGRFSENELLQKEGWFLPFRHLIQFIFPDYFGNPATMNYWGTWNYGELIGYIGIIPIVFVIVMLLQKKVKHHWFWIISGMVTLFLMLPTIIAKIPFYLHVPFLSAMQPTRFMVILVFSLIMLSAYGLDLYLRKDKKINSKMLILSLVSIIVVCGVVIFLTFISSIPKIGVIDHSFLQVAKRNLILPLILLGSAYVVISSIRIPKYKSFGIIALLMLSCFDLLRFSLKFTPFVDTAYFFPKTKIISFLEKQNRPFRVLALDQRILPPNVSTFYGIETPSGYDPIYPEIYEHYIAANNQNNPNPKKPYSFNRILIPELNSNNLFPLLNVKYVLSLSELTIPNFKLVMQEGETYLYNITNFLPRAFFVSSVEATTSPEESIAKAYDFNPQDKVFIDTNNLPLVEKGNPEDKLDIIDYSENKFAITTITSDSRLILLTNSYNPRWKAKLDGIDLQIYRVNGAFQGVVVPQGKHTVSFSYGK